MTWIDITVLYLVHHRANMGAAEVTVLLLLLLLLQICPPCRQMSLFAEVSLSKSAPHRHRGPAAAALTFTNKDSCLFGCFDVNPYMVSQKTSLFFE